MTSLQPEPFMATPPPLSEYVLLPATVTFTRVRVDPSFISMPPPEFLLWPPVTRPPVVTVLISVEVVPV